MRRILLVTLISVVTVVVLHAQESQLGKVEFPTSGSRASQAHFLRGLAALHSFWYEEALEAFRESTKADPQFVMGYWGEAMAYNHPLWSEQDIASAREALSKINSSSKLTPRERAYVAAVRLLYGEGDKEARDAAYSGAMEKIYREYPNDLDAAAFYALSVLAQVRSSEKSYRLQARAGAIALDVYQKNPNHPGAAHYIIHSFDDPEHAILALPAARRYASIAPEAHHARHMPSHIFLQLGMWPEAAASNESAWNASDAWMKRKKLSSSVRDYHSLHWLLYVYLQQGRYRKAEELLTLMKQTMSESQYENKLRPGYYQNNYANMAAAFVVETERWELASTLFPDGAGVASGSAPAHGAHGGASTGNGATMRMSNSGARLPVFVRALALAFKPDNINTLTSAGSGEESINSLEVLAVTAVANKDYEMMRKVMDKATLMEDALGPPSGPPGLIKPAHELYGELLLKAGDANAALEQFKKSLLRQPNRARSLIGAARAASKGGKREEARGFFATFLDQWKLADPELVELKEARENLEKNR